MKIPFMKCKHVIADSINNKTFKFTCPFCYTSYNKDGSPRKNSKRKVHIHGSSGELHNRIETRSPHCIHKQCLEFVIHITDDTLRE